MVDLGVAPVPKDVVWRPAHGSDMEQFAVVPLAPSDDSTALGGMTDLRGRGLRLLLPRAGWDALQRTKAMRAPAFWAWDRMESWLASPADQTVESGDLLFGLPNDVRTHVQVDGDKGTASDGDLFQTEGLVFRDTAAEYGLLLRTQGAPQMGVVRLGAEQRLSSLADSGCEWPALPDSVRCRLEAPGGSHLVRVILLTPGIFADGYRPPMDPDGRITQGPLQGARLVAAAVDRPQVMSGWDMVLRGPKPTRRFAPAGSVYWLEVEDPVAFASKLWMSSVCDELQDQLDGFGLCVVGASV